jgi:Cu(I)/Ag(I) efflux system periplasmic protein CusF
MKSISKLALAVALALTSASFTLANAEQAADSTQAEAPVSMSEGQVKKIDKDAGKITIKHGELKNLDMPPMTMVFRVKDPAMLEQVNAGDSISFVAEKVNGQLMVTRIEAKK